MLAKILERIRETGVVNLMGLSNEFSVDVQTTRGLLEHLADLGFLEVVHLNSEACHAGTFCFSCAGCQLTKNFVDYTGKVYRLREKKVG
ncbi:MAG: FeoC-like transcriptional regulator [Promethearchaeota archaeon]